MNSPDKILIALNTAEIPDSIFEFAITLSKTYKSQFVILHIFKKKKKNDTTVDDKVNQFYDKKEKKGLKDTQHIIEYGDFITTSLHIADDAGAKMILTESGNRDHNLEFLVPKIIRKTDLPVWCVKRNESQNIQKILCPVDFSKTSRRAFTDAVRLAKDLKSELVVLTVSEPTESTSEFINESEKELNKEKLENESKHLDDFLNSVDTGNVNIKKDVRQGSTVDEIIEKIRAHNAGLLVIGSHARTGLERKLLGSVTENVVNNAPSSFLVIKSRSLFE